VRAAAARALGDLGAPAAVPTLTQLLADDVFQVAHEAAHALRRLGPAGLAALREVVDTEDGTRSGAHARYSAAADHAREALALAGVLDGERVGVAA